MTYSVAGTGWACSAARRAAYNASNAVSKALTTTATAITGDVSICTSADVKRAANSGAFSAATSAPAIVAATVTATDPGAGMDYVAFPSLGAAGWGPGGNDTVVGPANAWTWDYSFTGGGPIGDPALDNATAFDMGGASTGSVKGRVSCDSGTRPLPARSRRW